MASQTGVCVVAALGGGIIAIHFPYIMHNKSLYIVAALGGGSLPGKHLGSFFA